MVDDVFRLGFWFCALVVSGTGAGAVISSSVCNSGGGVGRAGCAVGRTADGNGAIVPVVGGGANPDERSSAATKSVKPSPTSRIRNMITEYLLKRANLKGF